MVKNPRTPPRLDAIRSLNPPRRIQVETRPNARGVLRPMAVSDRGYQAAVARIEDSWRIDDEWWFRPIIRRYYRVVFTDGRISTIYHDLVSGDWYMQHY